MVDEIPAVSGYVSQFAGNRPGVDAFLAKAADGEQADVFAPLGGRVGGRVEAMLTDDHAGWRRTAALELVELDDPASIGPLPDRYDWPSGDGDAIRRQIAEGQLLTGRAKVRPLANWVADARQARAHTLIANVMENTPFVTADHQLLAQRGAEVVRGLAVLARAIGPRQVILAVAGQRTDA